MTEITFTKVLSDRYPHPHKKNMIRQYIQAFWRRASNSPGTWHPCRIWLRTFVVALCVFYTLLAAHAQDTNTPAPEYPAIPSLKYSPTPALSQAVETNLPPLPPPVSVPETPSAPPLAGNRQLSVPSDVPLPALPPLLRWGPLTLQPHLLYSLTYGNGLQASPGQQSSSFINEVDPGILLRWGSHWTLDYTPILRSYSSSAFRNTFDNSVTLRGTVAYEDWTFGLSQGYASSSDALIETGAQTDQQTFSTLLSANYKMSSKTSLDLGVSQSLRYFDQNVPGEKLNDYNSWSTTDWLDYQFWSRLSAGVGVGFGYANVKVGSDMASEQLQGRITWRVVNKLSFVLSGGAQDVQFLDSRVANLLSPVFSLSAHYSLFDTTTLSIGAYSAITPSYYQDQVTESTSVSAGLRQRLLGKLFLTLNGGYRTSTYHASTVGSAVVNSGNENYDSTFFSAGLATSFLKRGSVYVFCSVNDNSSGGATYNYTTSAVGCQLSYRF